MALRFLKVALELLADDFNNGLKAAQREAKEFEKTIKPTKELAKELGTAMAAAGTVVVASMVAMTKAAANYGDELLDASKRTGATVQDLARLKFAAEQSGASFGDVSTGLKVLANNLNAASEGSKAQVKAFKDIGVAVTDASGRIRPMNDVLLDVADRFARMEDGAEKSALAVELFGRGGIALIPVLNEGSAGLGKMGDMANRLGLEITRASAATGDEFNDAILEVQGAVQGLSNAVGDALLPSLTDMARVTRDGIVSFKDFVREHETLTKAFFGSAAAITGAGGLLLGLTAVVTIVPKVTAAFTALKVAMAGMFIGPAGLAVAGTVIVTGLVAAFLKYRDATSEVTQRLREMTNAIDDSTTSSEKLRRLSEEHARTNGKFLVNADQLNAAMKQARIEAENTARAQLGVEAATSAASKGLQGVTVDLKAGTIAYGNFRKEVAQTDDDIQKQLRAWQELEEGQENLRESTSNVIEATNELRRTLGTAQIERILGTIADRARMAATGFDEWVASIEDGSAASLRLVQTLHKNSDAFTNFGVTEEESRRANDARVAIFGDSLDEMVKEAEQMSVPMAKALSKPAVDMQKAFAVALGNVTSGFANAITDSLFKARNFGEALTGLAQSTAKNLLNALLVGLLEPLTQKLSGLGSKLGDLLGIGGGGASSAAGAAGSIGSAGSAGGGVAGGAGSLTAGLIGAAGGIIGGGLSALATMRTEGTLNAIEFNTRASRIHLEVMINELLHPMKNFVGFIADMQGEHRNQLDAIFNALVAPSGFSTGSNVMMTGRNIAAGTTGLTPIINASFAPVINFYANPTAQDMDSIRRQITEWWKLNTDGFLQDMILAFRAGNAGVVSGVA